MIMYNEEQYGKFKKKRQNNSIKIRRQNREQCFNRHRNQKLSAEFHILSQKQNATINNIKNNYDQQLSQDYSSQQVLDEKHTTQIKNLFNRQYTVIQLAQLKNCLFSQCEIQGQQEQWMLKKLEGIIGIRKLLENNDYECIDQIIDQKLLEQIAKLFIQQQYKQLQYQSILVISNMVHTHPQCIPLLFISNSDIISAIFSLLFSEHSQICEQAITTIGNIAYQSHQYRNLIIARDGIKKLIKFMEKSQGKLKQYCAWALSTLCRGKKLPEAIAIQEAILALANFIAKHSVQDYRTLGDCCYAISEHINGSSYFIEMLLNTSILSKMTSLLNNKSIHIVEPSVKIVAKIATGSSNQVSKLFKQPGLLDSLIATLKHTKRDIRKQTCWILTNLTITQKHINLILKNDDLFEILLYLLKTDKVQVKAEICRVFGNMAANGEAQTVHQFFCKIKVIQLLFQCLQQQSTTNNKILIQSVLQNLMEILQFGASLFYEETIRQNQYFIQLNLRGFYKLLRNYEQQAMRVGDTEFGDLVEEFLMKFYDNQDMM